MHNDRLINTESSLVSYFHEEIGRASGENHQPLCDHTHWYLTNLLHTYSATDRFLTGQCISTQLLRLSVQKLLSGA